MSMVSMDRLEKKSIFELCDIMTLMNVVCCHFLATILFQCSNCSFVDAQQYRHTFEH